MRVLKHVKLVNDVELRLSKLRQLESHLLRRTSRLLLLNLSELQVDFMLD